MYEAPEVRDLGTVEELTQVNPPYKNKIGSNPDATTYISGIVGSIVVVH